MATFKIVKTEKFNPDAMRALLVHDGISMMEKKKLKQYFRKKMDGNKVRVIYEFGKDYQKSEIGRVYADRGLSLQSMECNIRNALANDIYFDIDISNAHPTILLKMATDYGLECGMLKRYVENKILVRKEVAEAYNVDMSDAKNKLLMAFYLAETKLLPTFPYLFQFKQELDVIAKHVCDRNEDLFKMISRKHKHQYNKISSCLSLVLQTEEHRVLLEMDKYFTKKNRNVGVLIYDGCFIEREKGENNFDTDLLRGCEEHIKTTLGYNLRLEEKDVVSNLELKEIEGDDYINDDVAAGVFCKPMGDKLLYSDGKLLVFNDDNGMWTFDENIIIRYASRLGKALRFETVGDDGKTRMTDYGGMNKNRKGMFTYLPAHCETVDHFFHDNVHTSVGKLLFSDGIYDFDTNTFTEGFNPKIVFLARMNKPFPVERNEDIIQTVNKILFRDPFLADDSINGDFMKLALSLGLYGKYMMKKIYAILGETNAGKSAIGEALQDSFEGYVDIFNASNLLPQNRDSSDEEKKLAWLVPLANTRIVISNELKVDNALDGDMIKKVASGGDGFKARELFDRGGKMKNMSTLFMFMNDIPKIAPYDTAVSNKLECIEYKCSFVEKREFDANNPAHRLAKKDPDVKMLFKDVDFQYALFYLLADAYQQFLKTGYKPPPTSKKAREEWIGDQSSIEMIIKMNYRIPNKYEDTVSSREILEFLKTKNIMMSDNRLSREITKFIKLTDIPQGLKCPTGGADEKSVAGRKVSIRRGITYLEHDCIDNDNL